MEKDTKYLVDEATKTIKLLRDYIWLIKCNEKLNYNSVYDNIKEILNEIKNGVNKLWILIVN